MSVVSVCNTPSVPLAAHSESRRDMDSQDLLALLAALRQGNCLHARRVNICSKCLAQAEEIVVSWINARTPEHG